MRLAAGCELAGDADITETDPLVDGGNSASWQCDGLVLSNINLTLTENTGGSCFVFAAWARTGHEPHVRAGVIRARHGKYGDKGGVGRLTVGNPTVDLDLPCCIALVVIVDDGMFEAEDDRTNSISVNEADLTTTAARMQYMALRVDSVGGTTQFLFRVTLECL